jgi:outer membrane lipoprotein carrier protein
MLWFSNSIHASPARFVKLFVRPAGLLVGLLAVSAFAADTDVTRALHAVETRYNSAATLQVLFREDYTPPGRPHRSERGTLTLSKPGRMRWEYSQPAGKLWVSDGKRVSMYLPQENRVEQSALKESDDVRVPLGFLLGRLHFDKEFRNVQSHPEGTGIRILAEPKSDTLPYSQVEFLVSAQNQIREVKVTGFDKSILVYTFDEEKINLPVDLKLFQFRVPAGAEVVETGQ